MKKTHHNKKLLSTHTLLWGKQISIDIMITQQPHLHWILHFMKKKTLF